MFPPLEPFAARCAAQCTAYRPANQGCCSFRRCSAARYHRKPYFLFSQFLLDIFLLLSDLRHLLHQLFQIGVHPFQCVVDTGKLLYLDITQYYRKLPAKQSDSMMCNFLKALKVKHYAAC
nr:MAG TPA: hypothetical protein [Caudoviricetes sp.]